MKQYKYLLFDLDGTITDSESGITRCVEYALNHFGIQVNDLRELSPFIGPPLMDSFKDFYNFTDEQATIAVAKYRERYAVKGILENELYPGIKELLAQVRQNGKTVILATSKPEIFARRILDYFELSSYFRRRKWPGWFASYQNGCNQLYIRGKQYNEPRFSRHDRRQETRYHRCQKHRYRFYRRFIRIRRLRRTIGSRSGLHSRRYSGTPQITSVVLHYSSDFIHVFGVFLLLLHMKESNLVFAL